MIDKTFSSVEEAISDIQDGATIMIGGFGGAGTPVNLVSALAERGVTELTLICNSFNNFLPMTDATHAGKIKKAYLSYPLYPYGDREPPAFCKLAQAGDIEVEVVPQGTLTERIRAGGAGIAAFYLRVGLGTIVAEGKETQVFDGQEYLMERALKADFALIKAHQADRWGNLTYRLAARNFNPVMATAATVTIAEVDEVVDLGTINPEAVVTPGIHVDRVVKVEKKVAVFSRRLPGGN